MHPKKPRNNWVKGSKKLDEKTCRLLKIVVDHFDQEDKSVRERQIIVWRRLKFMWDGIQRTYATDVAHDWRIPQTQAEDDLGEETYYDKPVNVFRAYLESIIAALSVTVPPVTCYPDDADDELDLATASAGDKIAEKIYRHNNASLLWLRCLFIFGTEGLVAAYNYTKSDKKYGTYEKKEYEDDSEEHRITSCPLCGYELDDTVIPPGEELNESIPSEVPMESQMESQIGPDVIPLTMDEFDPDDSDAALHAALNEFGEICPACSEMMNPEIREESIIITRLIGVTQEPKTRVCTDAYGGLNVKVPVYARKQENCPYLSLSYEINTVEFIEKYPNCRNKYKGGVPSGVYDPYEAWGRLNTQYYEDFPTNVITERQFWLRPMAFNIEGLEDEEEMFLREKFPAGAKVILGNEEVVDYENENLDDHWTLTYNPLSDYLHHEPLGMLLTTIQEITNDIISLFLQTMEHGITQTFANPNVLNFNAYKKAQVRPGDIFPATPPAGKTLSDGFYDVKTATLSGEVLPIFQKIQELGQLVSGALPSLFGGQMEGTGTASEYSMSRSQALQRLGNVWKIFLVFWKEIYGKAIPAYIKVMQEDERDVTRDQFGNFMNSFIRKAELQGRIGRVEIEANENLPITWNQRKDIIMQLLNNGNPEILAIINSPENLPLIHEAIGINDFYIPGEADREKQYEEIKQLLNSEPILEPMGVDELGQPIEEEIPSVEIDPDVDNDEIQYETIRIWAVSSVGRQAKEDNPNGYRNVLLHGKMHKMNMMAKMMEQTMQTQDMSGAANPEKQPQDKTAPIKTEGDVNAAQ